MKLDTFTPTSFVLTIRPGYRVLFSFGTPVAAAIDGHYYKTDQIHSIFTSRQLADWIDCQGQNKHKCRHKKVETRPQDWFDNLGLRARP